VLLALGDHAEEAAVAHDRQRSHARHCCYDPRYPSFQFFGLRQVARRSRDPTLQHLALGDPADQGPAAHCIDPCLVESFEHRSVARRSHDPSMEHSGQPQVLHKGSAAHHLCRYVAPRDRLADDPMRRSGLRPRLRRCLAMQVGRGSKLRIAELAPVRRSDDSVGHLERGDIGAKAFCGKLEQDGAHLRAGKPQRRAAVLDRLAARGHAFVRRPFGVARNHLHPLKRQIELLRRDLRQCRHDALAELDLAGADRGVAVAADANPGIEQAVVIEAAGKPCWLLRSGLLREREPRSQREGEGDAAEPGDDVAP
jgi:hypothetical protein